MPHQNLREKIQQTNSPQKNPKRKYMSKKNTSPKSKGEQFQQTNSPEEIQRENI